MAYDEAALDLLISWSKPREISPKELAQADPLAAQIMESTIFARGGLKGIKDLPRLALELAMAVRVDKELKDPEAARARIEKKFSKLFEAYREAADTYLYFHLDRISQNRAKRPTQDVKKCLKELEKIKEKTLAKLESIPEPRPDLIEMFAKILQSHCQGVKPYTIGRATKELLEVLNVYVESDSVRKRIERKAKPRAR